MSFAVHVLTPLQNLSIQIKQISETPPRKEIFF